MIPARRPYDYHWRTVTRPRILRRAGGSFDARGRYLGMARCQFEGCGLPDYRPNGRSALQIAHLVIPWGEPGHDDDSNLACLCDPCHKRHDYPAWAAKVHQTWLEKADKAVDEADTRRPILDFLRAGMEAQQAVDRAAEGV